MLAGLSYRETSFKGFSSDPELGASGKIFFGGTGVPSFELPDYTVAGLTASYASTEKFKFSLDINNLFDERYTQSVCDLPLFIQGDQLIDRILLFLYGRFKHDVSEIFFDTEILFKDIFHQGLIVHDVPRNKL